MKTIRNHACRWLTVTCVLTGLLAPTLACAQGKWGYKKKGDTSWQWASTIIYRPSGDQYRVRLTGGTGIDVPRAAILGLNIPEPSSFKEHVRNLGKSGIAGATAVSGLEAIARKYNMLQWDIKAFEALVPIYSEKGQHQKVMDACKRVKDGRGKVSDSLVQYHWQALLATGKKGKLGIAIRDAIATGSRSSSAAAHLVRGDLYMKEGKPKDALIQGYLRVVLLFKDVKAIQPEALYKAWKALKEQGDSRANRMRRKLLEEYPSSDYAKKIS
jgi:hypothetical protein